MMDEINASESWKVPNTDLFFEANLSANSIVTLCYTVIEKMGLDKAALSIESET